MDNIYSNRLQIAHDIAEKFKTDVKLDEKSKEQIIYTELTCGWDSQGNLGDYYKVITIDKIGRIKSYMSEDTTSSLWYSTMLV